MTVKHKTFISFHHYNDEEYKIEFERLFAKHYGSLITKAVADGAIETSLQTNTIRAKIRDEYLSDSTVTVVLIGSETWKRKHVDWEISSSIMETRNSSRSGLLGIILPSYPRSSSNKYTPTTIPPRLYDNVKCGYSKIYNWTDNPNYIMNWIHEAFVRRSTIHPDNSYPMFVNNKSASNWSY